MDLRILIRLISFSSLWATVNAGSIAIQSNSVSTGDDVEAVTGQQYTVLVCTYQTVDEPTLKWYKGSIASVNEVVTRPPSSDPAFSTGYDRHDLVDQASLQINQTIVEDSDTYFCQVSGMTIGTLSDSLNLNVTDPIDPLITNLEIKEDPVIKHLNATIVCTGQGNPKPSYSWLQNGDILPDFERYHLLEHNSVLFINGVLQQDASTYTCVVSNMIGTYEADVFLDVSYAPTNISISDSCSSSQVALTCTCNANPDDVIYTWYLETQDPREGNLVTIGSWNGGNVTCKAENSIGYDASHKYVEKCSTNTGLIVFVSIMVCLVVAIVVIGLLIQFLPACSQTKAKIGSSCTCK